MNRRAFLTATATAATFTAGCLDSGPPTAANEYNYETTSTRDGPDVPLVPVEDAIDWYTDNDIQTIFVDARDETAYDQARITNAILSPAPDGLPTDDPLQDHATDTRIVTYCVCPHRLAALRAATLITNGYTHTYALDEGLNGWYEAGYPVEGQEIESRPNTYEITGQTSSEHANELIWARHEPTNQREAATIAADGQFTLHIQFHDITPEAEITLETPDNTHTAPLEDLTGTTVEL